VGVWMVLFGCALWLFDGVAATVRNRFQVAMRSLYFDSALRVLPPRPRAFRVAGFVHKLLLHTVRACPLDAADRMHAALLTVLVDQLDGLPDAALFLPRTDSPAAELGRPVASIAHEVGMSVRTLERAFLADTGMSLGAWR